MKFLDIDFYMPDGRIDLKKIDEVLTLMRAHNVIIYGAGSVGRSLLPVLKSRGIKIQCFIDKAYAEINNVYDAPVLSPEVLRNKDNNNLLIIIAVNVSVIKKVREEIYANIENCVVDNLIIDDGAELVHTLKYYECYHKTQAGEKLNIAECLDCSGESKHCDIYENYLKKLAKAPTKTIAKKPSKSFDWFGCIMGQVCTLKCKHCCEHVPYMKSNAFSDADELIADCQKIAYASEFLRYIELIGGEPFLHPKFIYILKGLLNLENVGYIKTFTNGTVVPSDELCELFQDERLMVNFSNYTEQATGKLLENMYATREKLDKYNIPYIFSTTKLWTDWGNFELRNKTDEQLKRDFHDCFCSDCHRLYEGILYRCPHQYAGIVRGKMNYIESEIVRVRDLSIDDLGLALENFELLPYTDGCKRCDMPYDCPVVPAGEQL